MSHIKEILPIAFVAALLLMPQFAHSQNIAPLWLDDAWRSSHYSQSQWYTGFSQDRLKPNAKTAEALKWLERDAQNKMAESVALNISGKSIVENTSTRKQQGQNYNEKTSMDYKQMIQASTSAEMANTQTYSYHDEETNRIYAFTAVRKADLSNYYAYRAEFYQQKAENDLNLAKQLSELGRKRNALEKIEESKKNIEESGKYQEFLGAVEYDGNKTQILLSKEAALLKELSIEKLNLENKSFIYVETSEQVLNESTEILGMRLKGIMHEKGFSITENNADANLHLNVKANSCNMNKYESIFFCYTCVNITLNGGSSKSVYKNNITVSKQGWRDEKMACQKSIEGAALEIWEQLAEKIKERE